MKKIVCGALLLCAVCTFSFAKEGSDQRSMSGIGIDYALVGRQNNFGLSAALTLSWLFDNSLAFRANTDYFFPSADHRSGFFVLDCSVMGGHIMQTANIRLYGGGGAVALFPMKSDEPTVKLNHRRVLKRRNSIAADRYGKRRRNVFKTELVQLSNRTIDPDSLH